MSRFPIEATALTSTNLQVRVIPSAMVTITLASTGAPVTVYTESTGATTTTNPFPTDSIGNFSVWVEARDLVQVQIEGGGTSQTYMVAPSYQAETDTELSSKTGAASNDQAVELSDATVAMTPGNMVAGLAAALARTPAFSVQVTDISETSGAGGSVVASSDGKEVLGFDASGRARLSDGLALYKTGVDTTSDLLHLVELTQTDGTYPLVFAVNAATGEASIGSMDDATRRRNGLAAYASGARNIHTGNAVLRLGYGQSLSIGGGQTYSAVSTNDTLPVTHHAMSPWMQMFDTGLCGTESDAIGTIRDFVPAREEWELPRGLGQTQGSGMMLQSEVLNSVGGRGFDTQVYHTFGRGGWSISELSDGSVPYANGEAAMAAFVSVAAQYGLTPVCYGTTWTQGEEDRSDGTTLAVYKAALIQLQDDLNASLQAEMPRATAYKLWVDQLSASATSGTPTTPGLVAQAQMEAARDDAGIVLVGPGYPYPRIDTVHSTAKGYDLMGERHAWWQHRVEVLGLGSAPCWNTAITRSGTTITVTVNVPNGNLVIDTATLNAHSNMGFSYSGAGITDVSVGATSSGSCDITITLDADAGGVLAYAWDGDGEPRGADGAFPHAGAWGNIRDGGGAEVASVTHPGEIIANWLCIFQETIA